MGKLGLTVDATREMHQEAVPVQPKRIIGLDVARAFAIWGMVVVNYRNALDAPRDPAWLHGFVARFQSRASVTFVVLAGIGISLLSARARRTDDDATVRAARRRLIQRGAFLLVLGCAFFVVWPGDILHFYAFYLTFSALFIRAPDWVLWAGVAAAWVGHAAFILFAHDPRAGIDGHFYMDFWSLRGFFRNVFFNGHHPVFPWFAFLLMGMWLGRRNLGERQTQAALLSVALALALSGEFGARWLMANTARNDWTWLWTLSPRLASPFFMAAATGTAVAVIMTALILSDWFRSTLAVRILATTGQLALTNYLGHIVIALGGLVLFRSLHGLATGADAGIFDELTPRSAYRLLGGCSLPFAVGLAVAYYGAAIAFSYAWRRRFAHGPLEWFMRCLAG